MKSLDSISAETSRNLIDHNVDDESGEHIGTIQSFWSDENTGKLEFLGIKTGWFFGKTHVVPVQGVQFEEEQNAIRVPYPASFIKEAPNFDPENNLSEAEEDEIFNYYGVNGASTQPAVTESARSDRAAIRPAPDAEASSAEMALHEEQLTSTQPAVTESARSDRAAIRPAPDAEANSAEMALHEEQLKVGKRNVVAGQVRLHKIVRTEEVNVPVELKSEHVVIERIPASEAKGTGATSFNEERIEIPLSREEAVVEKVSQVTGGVRVRKTEEVRQETVHDSVRREDVEEERVDSSEKIPQK
jgi:uncharacterized protein (TIGR02271 family)